MSSRVNFETTFCTQFSKLVVHRFLASCHKQDGLLWIWQVLNDFLPSYLGILLDSFVSATRQIRERIEDNDYKVSQTVQVKNKSYGILVRDKDLTKCFKWTIEESWLFESDDIYGIITQRIHVGSKVTKYVV